LKQLLRERHYEILAIFLVGLIVRLMLMPFLASGDLNAIWNFVTLSMEYVDPWQAVLDTGMWSTTSAYPPPFPYPAIMLYILVPFRAISYLWNQSMTPDAAGLFLLKTPLLIMDVMSYYIISRLVPNKAKIIGVLWWLNPVSIYISYYHGHLDIIPVALILFSILLAVNKKYYFAFILLGIAGATKSFPLLILPILLLDPEIRGIFNKAKFGIITVTCYFLCMVPFQNSEGFRTLVTDFEEKNRIYSMTFNIIGELDISLFFVVYVFVLLYLLQKVNDRINLFLFGSGAILLLPVLFIPPQFTWFMWALPFLVIFLGTLREYYYYVIVFCFAWFGYYLTFPWTEVFSSWRFVNTDLSVVPRIAVWLGHIDKYDSWLKYSKVVFSVLWGFALFCFVIMCKKVQEDRSVSASINNIQSGILRVVLPISIVPVLLPIVLSVVLTIYPAEIVDEINTKPANTDVGEVISEKSIEQSFISARNRLNGFALKTLTYWDRSNTEEVIIKLYEEGSDSAIVTNRVNPSETVDQEYLFVEFNPIEDSMNKVYHIYIESPTSTVGNAITFGATSDNPYKNGDLQINGKIIEDVDLNMKITYLPNGISIKRLYGSLTNFIWSNPVFCIIYTLLMLMSFTLLIMTVRSYKNRNNQKEVISKHE